MNITRTSNPAPTRTAIKSVAIPNEHGGWMFLLEPALLGLGIAPSIPGALLGLAALGAFLTRHPLKIALDDRRKNKRFPRTALAERFALLYGLIAALAFVLAILAAHTDFWLPLLLAAPFALVQFYFDARKRSREAAAELCGAVAMSAIAPTMLLMAGQPLQTALIVWVLLAARAVTAILYVRARLRLEHDKPAAVVPVWLIHGATLLFVVALAASNLAPWLAAVAMLVLLVRALWGLSRWHKPARAQIVGVQEVVMGFITIILIAAGYWISG